MGQVRDHYCIGIDPGYGMTGIVLVDPTGEVLADFAAAHPPVIGQPEHERAVRFTTQLWAAIDQMLEKIPPDSVLRYGIETPVYTGHPVNFSKQWRLVQEIEARLHANSMLDMPVQLAEIGPTTSKKLLTGKGDADKRDVIMAGPYRNRPDLRDVTREALADAYAHAHAAKLTEDYHMLWRCDVV